MPEAASRGKRPVALVTGGAKRIGAAICRDLARDHRVVVHHNSSRIEAEALAREIGGSTVSADLSLPANVQGLVAKAAEAAGAPVAVLVNNASTFQARTLDEVTSDDLDAMMHLHAWAPLALARQAHAEGATCIVNLLDTRIVRDDQRHVAYHLSKQALANLTVTLARRLAPCRVNAIAPGPVLPATDGLPDNMDAAVAATLLKRPGTPAEVAHAVRFMVDADYITGQVLHVSGGRDIA